MPFNPVVAGGAAGAAFVTSFILGALNGAGAGYLFMRALLFAALFFALSSVFMVVFQRFLEVEYDEHEDAGQKPVSDDNDNEEFSEEESAPPNDPLEQNNNSSYNADGQDSFAEKEISFNAEDFTPGLPVFSGAQGASEGNAGGNAPEENFSLGNVELSVGKRQKKEVELSDLGPNVDGKKVAQAIQTMLKKDDS